MQKCHRVTSTVLSSFFSFLGIDFYLLGTYFWSFFIIFAPNLLQNWSRCPLLASLGLLLASSGAPFGSPWTHFGAPWPPFCHAKTPLEANLGHFQPPSLILDGFFINFLCFSAEILLISVSFLHIFFEGFISLSLISAHPSSHASYYCSARKEQKAVYGKCVYVAREVTDQSSSD